MKKISYFLFNNLIWTLILVLISGDALSINKHPTLSNVNKNVKEIAEQIKSNIKSDPRYQKTIWKVYANSYINFVDSVVKKEENRSVSKDYAKTVLTKSYDLFQSGSYQPNKARMLYFPAEEEPTVNSEKWLPETPPKK